MYFRDAEAWSKWFQLARGQLLGRTYEALAEQYRFGVCTADYDRLRWIVERDPRLEVVLDSGDAWVFRVDRQSPEISLDEFLRLGDAPGAVQ